MSDTPTTDIWGSDIALDEHNQAIVAANGEIVLTEGVDTGTQDIKLRVLTYFGTLFYDTEYGSFIFDFIYDENTQENRAAFIAELETCIEKDPRVKPYTVKASILKWDAKILQCSVLWNFIDQDQPLNLVMQINKETKELIVSDAKPNSDKLSSVIS